MTMDFYAILEKKNESGGWDLFRKLNVNDPIIASDNEEYWTFLFDIGEKLGESFRPSAEVKREMDKYIIGYECPVIARSAVIMADKIRDYPYSQAQIESGYDYAYGLLDELAVEDLSRIRLVAWAV